MTSYWYARRSEWVQPTHTHTFTDRPNPDEFRQDEITTTLTAYETYLGGGRWTLCTGTIHSTSENEIEKRPFPKHPSSIGT